MPSYIYMLSYKQSTSDCAADDVTFPHSPATIKYGTVPVPWLRLLVTGLPPRRPGFDPGSVHVGFVVDKVALGRVFSPEYFGFPC
jgi:hypothetical protein